MIFLKKILFLFLFLFLFLSCGTEDIIGNIATGGLYGLAKGVSNLNDPCKLGLSSCDDGSGIPHIKEVNNSTYVDPKDLNTTPSLVAENTNVVLNVGEQYNVLLRVTDQDLDEVVVTSLVSKPSIASSIVLKAPDRLLITALASGDTFAKAYGTDDDSHVGESQIINITVLGGNGNNASVEEHSVELTKNKIKMGTGGFQRIGYTVRGLQSDYNVEWSIASSNNKLVDVNVSKSATSIDIYSNATQGTAIVSFTFKDSAGVTLIKDLQIEVTDTGINPPSDPDLTSYTVRDPEACRDSSAWKKLRNSYSVGERAIDDLNSLTFQSLSTATNDITLYYSSSVVDAIQQKPDNAMDIKVDEVPNLDGTRDSSKGFIIQTSKPYFGAGFYYAKIDNKCYRGEFPKSDSVKNHDIYKAVKLVVD